MLTVAGYKCLIITFKCHQQLLVAIVAAMFNLTCERQKTRTELWLTTFDTMTGDSPQQATTCLFFEHCNIIKDWYPTSLY